MTKQIYLLWSWFVIAVAEVKRVVPVGPVGEVPDQEGQGSSGSDEAEQQQEKQPPRWNVQQIRPSLHPVKSRPFD